MTVAGIDPAAVDPGTVELIDVRDRERYEEGHIPGAESVPLDDLEDVVDRREWSDEVVVACSVGETSRQATRLIDAYAEDATVASMSGGYEAWDGSVVATGTDAATDPD